MESCWTKVCQHACSRRYRLSRRRISQWLVEFYGIELSIGTIDKVIREAGLASEPLEEELIREIEKSDYWSVVQ